MRMSRLAIVGLASLAIVLSSAACADVDHSAAAPLVGATQDTPEGVVEAFAAALRAGDAAAVRQLMAPNVIIAESGGVERSFDEYATQHLPADIAFMAGIRVTLERRDTIVAENMATVISRAQFQGQFEGRPIHSNSMETMVLRQIGGYWRIVHVHWSSSPITGRD